MELSFHDQVVFQQVQGFYFIYGDFRARKNLEIEILTLASGTSPTSLTSCYALRPSWLELRYKAYDWPSASSLGRLVSDIPLPGALRLFKCKPYLYLEPLDCLMEKP